MHSINFISLNTKYKYPFTTEKNERHRIKDDKIPSV